MANPNSKSSPERKAHGVARRRYRIVQLTSSSDIGGTERMVLNLVERLDRERFEPIVFSLVGAGALIAQCRERGIEAEHLEARHALSPRPWIRFWRMARRRSFDLVHLYGLRANLPGRPLARACGVRAVVAGIRNIDPWRKWYHSAPDRLTARWVDRFVSNCEAGRQAAIERERFDPRKVVVIYSGIEEKPLADGFDRAQLMREFNVAASEGPVVAVVANLRPQKRHRDLIDAAVALAERLPRIVFLCAGHDRMHGWNQRYAVERGVAEHFRWLGHVGEVEKVVAACDFAALPSSFEGLPASVLEAMAMGRTVIATPVGGVPEVITDGVNGLLVPVGDVAALAKAIERLAADADLRGRLQEAARKTVQERFSLDRMVAETERLYLELLEGQAGSGSHRER